MTGSVLAPLAARYTTWLTLPPGDTAASEEDPTLVWVMPLVLRLERGDRSARSEILAAAATASLLVCLDPRAERDGAWREPLHHWISGRIRKVARRARGSHWRAVQQLPGVTVTVGDAEVRALVPTRVADTPREVSRLQISGGVAAVDERPRVPPGVPSLLVNPALDMSLGKTAAQAGHATMTLAAMLDDGALRSWAAADYGCAVRDATEDEWRQLVPGDDPAGAWRERGVVATRDAGLTEVDPGTITVLGVWGPN